MSGKCKTILWSGVLGITTLLLGGTIAASQSRSSNPNETAHDNGVDQGRFIAAFEWSVERNRNYVWPFESLPPAPYDAVWFVVESMPRAWSEKRVEKASVPLSAYTCLRVNGRSLPKPRVMDQPQEFVVSLEKGRLRFLFTLPAGFKLDSRYAIIRVQLYQISK